MSKTLQAYIDELEARPLKEPGLEVMHQVYAQLPKLSEKTRVISVAGTNGKGSCVHLLDALLRAHDYTTVRLTSPHLHSVKERVCINGVIASDALWEEGLAAILSLQGADQLSYFETITLLAFWLAQHASVDFLLLEVGLGGRLDAVNVHPADMAIITQIHFDHEKRLGNTLDAIGQEKAGIIHDGCITVLANEEMPNTVIQRAKQYSKICYVKGQDFQINYDQKGCQYRYCWQGATSVQGDVSMGVSAASLSGALKALEYWVSSPDSALVQEVTAHFSLPGRFEQYDWGVPWVFDVAHNPSSAALLASNVKRCFPDKRVVAVFGVMVHKNWSDILDCMMGVVDCWLLYPPTDDRWVCPKTLGQYLKDRGVLTQKIEMGKTMPSSWGVKNDVVLVFGSFFLVSVVQRDMGLAPSKMLA